MVFIRVVQGVGLLFLGKIEFLFLCLLVILKGIPRWLIALLPFEMLNLVDAGSGLGSRGLGLQIWFRAYARTKLDRVLHYTICYQTCTRIEEMHFPDNSSGLSIANMGIFQY